MPDSDPNDITRSHVQLAHGSIIGHYRIIEKIGAGGMGEVYLAEDTKLDRKVALKFLPLHLCQDPECRARFTREAQAAAKLDHPNIIQVHEVSEYSGRPFIAMQYVEGCSLKEYIAQQELSLPRILELGMQICDGLEAAHKAGVIHRDIKPSNILIDSHGRARIVDFGLAAVRGADHLTRTGSTLGTLHYMSPEQTRGEPLGEPSDIFSFGVVLYEMIAGQLPFKGEHEPAILHSIGYEEPEPLARFRAGIPDELQRIIGKMLAKQKDERYQHADDLLADLKHAASLLGTFPGLRKHRLRVVIPSIIAVGVLVLALVLKPWKFEISPTHETQASTNWLAVMYFDNITDPADSKRLGEIATNLLITGLSQSEYVKVMSSQRLYDLLKQMGKEGVKTIDRATASQIARKAEAKWMLTGSILQSEPRIVLTSQMIDVASGGVIASQRVTGNPGEDIFAVIDRLTEDVKKSSALPATVRTESSVKIADVTTHSPEAYRHYLEGLEYWNKYYNEEGRNCMHKAIEYDSTFADAYAMLAMMSDFGTPEFEKAITQAMKYIDRASDRDRQRLTSMLNALQGNYDEAIAVTRDYLVRYPDDKEFWYGLAGMYSGSGRARNSDSIIVCCNRALALDPNFRMAQNLLAYALDESGRHKEAIDAINKYIQLAPNEANPYDSRGDLYAASGKLDSALDSYQKALSIKPDFQESLKKKGYMYMFLGQYPQAENAFRTYFSNLGKPARGYWRASLTYIPIYRGKFREALRIADECIAANKVDDLENTNWVMYALKSEMYDWLGKPDSALAMLRFALALADKEALNWAHPHLRSWQAILTFKAGDTATAKVLIDQLARDAESKKAYNIEEYWDAKGEIALYTKDFTGAIEYLARRDSITSAAIGSRALAEAYFWYGDKSRAIDILEKNQIKHDQNRVFDGAHSVKGYYLLGCAYDEIGARDKAYAALEKFLTIWKDADPGIKEVEDAKARLTRLKAKS